MLLRGGVGPCPPLLAAPGGSRAAAGTFGIRPDSVCWGWRAAGGTFETRPANVGDAPPGAVESRVADGYPLAGVPGTEPRDGRPTGAGVAGVAGEIGATGWLPVPAG